MKTIPYGKQFIDDKDRKLINLSTKKQLITTGDYVDKLEKKLKKYLKSKFALVSNSGTASLHMAFFGSNLRKGDIIIMPVINFISAYNVAKFMNLKVYFADVDRYTGQMTPKTLTDCIKKNKITKPKAILLMYLGGYAENIYEFYKLKKKYKFIIIEDACHAFGSEFKYSDKFYKVGSCKLSDLACFSFHPLKSITTGEGGAVTTNNKIIYNRMKIFRSHGIEKKNHWNYDINFSGLNYRISDINCALGISQLSKINKFITFRKKIYNLYKENFKKISDLLFFPTYKNLRSSFHLTVVHINFKKINKKKDEIFEFFKNKGIYLQYHYKPITKFSFVKTKKHFPESLKYERSGVSLPIYYQMKKKEFNKIKKFLLFFLKK